jgi:STIP1 family protein 1
MENPVLTEAGHCYEKEVLEEHFSKNGFTDPCTRRPVSGRIIVALNIKQAIEYFLLNNPWAFEFTSGEDYREIQF